MYTDLDISGEFVLHDSAESDIFDRFAESNTFNASRESEVSDISGTFELFDSAELDTFANCSE